MRVLSFVAVAMFISALTGCQVGNRLFSVSVSSYSDCQCQQEVVSSQLRGPTPSNAPAAGLIRGNLAPPSDTLSPGLPQTDAATADRPQLESDQSHRRNREKSILDPAVSQVFPLSTDGMRTQHDRVAARMLPAVEPEAFESIKPDVFVAASTSAPEKTEPAAELPSVDTAVAPLPPVEMQVNSVDEPESIKPVEPELNDPETQPDTSASLDPFLTQPQRNAEPELSFGADDLSTAKAVSEDIQPQLIPQSPEEQTSPQAKSEPASVMEDQQIELTTQQEPIVLHARPVQSHTVSNAKLNQPAAAAAAIDVLAIEQTLESSGVDPEFGLPTGNDIEFIELPEMESDVHQDAQQVVYRDESGRPVLAPPTHPATGSAGIVSPGADSIIGQPKQYYLPPQQLIRLRAETPLGKVVPRPSRATILMRDTVIVRGRRLLDDDGTLTPQQNPSQIAEDSSDISPRLRQALRRLTNDPVSPEVKR